MLYRDSHRPGKLQATELDKQIVICLSRSAASLHQASFVDRNYWLIA